MNKCRLGDLFCIKQGYAFKSEKYVLHSNYILCTLANFSESNNFKFSPEKATYYPDEFSHEFILSENDLIIPLTEQVVGLFGNTAFVPKTEGFQFVLNQRVGKIIPYEEKADKLFLHYLLSTQLVRDQIEATASGTKQRNTSPDKIYDVIVWIPNIDQQRTIGRYLYSLEKKCNINNKICSELEAMAKTLYDYWFVQFDFPDENGRPYRASGGKMVWNPQLKREIPKGWEAGTIGQIGNVISGGTPTTTREDYYCNHGIAWITPNDLSKNEDKMFISHGERDITQRGLDNSSAVLMPKHSVLLSTRAPIGYLAISSNEICTNQGFKSIVPNAGYHEYFIYYLIKRNVPAIAQQGVGTTFKEVSKDTLSNFAVPLPPKSLVNNFAEKVTPLCEKRCILEEENHELKRVRDWLLPMLMNGQARVE